MKVLVHPAKPDEPGNGLRTTVPRFPKVVIMSADAHTLSAAISSKKYFPLTNRANRGNP